MESFINNLLINYFKVIRKFSEFTGRTQRREFWMFMLCNFIVYLILGILGSIPLLGKLFNVVSVLYSIVILVPSIAVGVRRLHDTGKTGFLMLLTLIPVVGAIIVLVLCAYEGNSGINQYGSDPKIEA